MQEEKLEGKGKRTTARESNDRWMRGGTQLKPLLKVVETKEAMSHQNAQPWSFTSTHQWPARGALQLCG